MKFRPTRFTCGGKRSGFTLAEVLAALALMAIVIPVAVEGLRIANLAGQVGQRKEVATRIADRMLNELMVTAQWRTSRSGTVQDGTTEYRWSLTSEPWPDNAMRLITVQVLFPVQGRDYDVHLSTLVDPNVQ
jgi:prepilin-type N-terminal cleavage/methylation domain-containing protein